MAIDKSFDFNNLEKQIYDKWEKSHVGASDVKSKKDSVCLIMPPPNVTGNLHCGHAMEHSITDIYARFCRAQGKDVLWQPGLDHAGIATQLMVERKISAEQGKSRYDLGREKFLEEVWKWKNESGGEILNQIRRLGACPDWDRLKFTLDEDVSSAVRKVFISLYNDGLIFKGQRLVNWDIALQTAVSDLEVENKETVGKMYYFNYPIDGKEGEFIQIGTTRPETMFGDTAIAVHPENEKIGHLIGKSVKLPMIGRVIPIIADEYADPEKGTGAVKITPAHDFNDFEVGKRNSLAMISIMNKDGSLNDKCPEEFVGMDRLEARPLVIKKMEELGLFVKAEDNNMAIPYGERSKEIVEPMLTEQWFIDTKKMAERSMAAVKDGETEILPKFVENTFFHFLNNIQDWCISRQLWWGHRIPAFYGEDGHCFVAENEEEALEQAVRHYGKSADEIELKQDNDVLDTWFSSALWPFTTLGWNGVGSTSEELEKYYPTSLLITGRDLVFFWYSRMMMMGTHFLKDFKGDDKKSVPFEKCFFHGLVNDEHGKKMSKSKGNGVDPIELMDKYGADACRFYFASATTQGNDINLSEKQIEGYRNFVTKIWNACKFIEMQCASYDETFDPFKVSEERNKWVLERLKTSRANVYRALKDLRFNDATSAAYDFVWKEFCDWFIEMGKVNPSDESKATLAFVRDEILKLLHPFMPFVTEELWGQTSDRDGLLASEVWKLYGWDFSDTNIDDIIELIQQIRTIKADLGISASAFIDIEIKEKLENNTLAILETLARCKALEFGSSEKTLYIANPTFNVKGVLNDNIDIDIEKKKKDLAKLEGGIKAAEGRFNNENFVKNVPENVLMEQKISYEKNKIKAEKLRVLIETLG
jgi:valyl-tRNA synthetase